ncbi:IclR family transcriptional regulator [Marivibrio halodurans]|uniref:IclR family transcriptional regulator n=1 Tax=Marivibrio halodurans TaxID=2039722 RepID=A0A8J7S2F2_9PROT|nr:IclR family transcriptional regulator [Marivibrio halodurans]MBP5858595.1 IclR family transcriptional regulator [Marivibrio halodurans]
MRDDTEKPEKAAGRIQSLERAFAILEETARHRDGVTLTHLSRALGLHTSTLYHLIKTLTALGYLHAMGDSKRYRVGRGIFLLASACHDEIELSNTVAPFLDRLAEETGESTHFAIWERDSALILARASGSKALQMTERAGTLRPLYCTAIGKALLSGLDEAEYETATHAIAFDAHTSNTLKGPTELRLQVEKARHEGVAFDDCEYNAEVRCMAAPVRDFRGKVIGAIGFSGPVWRMSFSDMATYIPRTAAIAAELSESLGHTHPTPGGAAEDGRADSA